MEKLVGTRRVGKPSSAKKQTMEETREYLEKVSLENNKRQNENENENTE